MRIKTEGDINICINQYELIQTIYCVRVAYIIYNIISIERGEHYTIYRFCCKIIIKIITKMLCCFSICCNNIQNGSQKIIL